MARWRGQRATHSNGWSGSWTWPSAGGAAQNKTRPSLASALSRDEARLKPAREGKREGGWLSMATTH